MVETALKKSVEFVAAKLLMRFSKIMRMHDYTFHCYYFSEANKLDLKPHFVDTKDPKDLYYFKECAFEEFNDLNPRLHLQKKGLQQPNKDKQDTAAEPKKSLNFKNCSTMYFQSLQTQTDKSKLTITKFKQEDDKGISSNLSKNEILGHIYLSLLDSLDYVDLQNNKFKILGAGLMRKFDDDTELI